jgi:hypothetical protein
VGAACLKAHHFHKLRGVAALHQIGFAYAKLL